jgi:signal transduction histidine kinase
MIATIKNWYTRLEAKNLAKLTPAERVDVLAFDAAFKRHLWRNLFLYAGIWLLLAGIGKLAFGRIGWIGAFMLAGVVQISLTLSLTSIWFGPSRFKVGLKSALLLMGITLAGAVVGGLSAKLALTSSLDTVMAEFARIAPQLLIGGLIAGLAFAVLMVSMVQYRRGQLLRHNVQLLQQTQKERLGRQLADARLKLLQAQVEPHFLFNTLASVQQLAEGRAPEAAQLTAQLITFLRAGLASLREETTTLAREFSAIEAYLTIMQTRMPDRLQFGLDLPGEIRDLAMPPAMLISLVENAIKHGLEPHPEGGRIDVSARAEGGRLRLTVADTGQGPGMSKVAGGGVGLDNIRQRLRALFAGDARLEVSANVPRGFFAVIDLPIPANTESTELAAGKPV